MRSKLILAAAIISAFIYSCSPKMTAGGSSKVAETKPEDQLVVHSIEETEKIFEGAELFKNNCATCHKLYAPKDYTREQWQPIVKRMQRKARLDDVQGDNIYAFLASQAK
ncbi:MAG TPA: cytochrome c [Flavobacterium sp.]